MAWTNERVIERITARKTKMFENAQYSQDTRAQLILPDMRPGETERFMALRPEISQFNLEKQQEGQPKTKVQTAAAKLETKQDVLTTPPMPAPIPTNVMRKKRAIEQRQSSSAQGEAAPPRQIREVREATLPKYPI